MSVYLKIYLTMLVTGMLSLFAYMTTITSDVPTLYTEKEKETLEVINFHAAWGIAISGLVAAVTSIFHIWSL